jgi:hypothetical protein
MPDPLLARRADPHREGTLRQPGRLARPGQQPTVQACYTCHHLQPVRSADESAPYGVRATPQNDDAADHEYIVKKVVLVARAGHDLGARQRGVDQLGTELLTAAGWVGTRPPLVLE